MLDNSNKYDSNKIMKKAQDNFSSRIIGEKIVEVYKEVLEKK